MLKSGNFVDVGLLQDAVVELTELHEHHPDLRIAGPEIKDLLKQNTVRLLGFTASLNPASYGTNHQKVPQSKTPFKTAQKIATLKPQTYTHDGVTKTLAPQYASTELLDKFHELNHDLQQALGCSVVIQSAFRSPTYQAMVFVRILHQYKGDITRTMQRVAPPGYSEHGDPINTAVDLMRSRITGKDDDFETSLHYKWLQCHASKYGFFLSFPPNNPDGVDFEPWHWRFNSKRS